MKERGENHICMHFKRMPSENCFPFIQICEKFNSILLISFASFVVKTTVQEDLVKLPLHKAKSIVST